MYSFIKPFNNPFISTGLLLILAFLGFNCEHVGPLETEIFEDEEEIITLSSIQSIFTQNCALSGCHVGANALMGLDLSEGQTHASIVGKQSMEVPALQLVSAFNPDESYLVMKLEGSPRIATGTLLMPIGRSPLDQEVIDRIRAWIADGALDN